MATSVIKEFFNSLQTATIKTVDKTNILEFETPIRFAPLCKRELKSLMIRQCYPDLYKLIVSPGQLDTILIGNSGIGQSFFGVYLMYKLIEADETFLYEPNVNNVVILYNGKRAIDNSPRKHRIEVLNADTIGFIYKPDKSIIHIVDDHAPKISPFRIVLTCSPRFNVYKGISNKRACSVFYVPVWTQHEIEECRRIVYQDLDADIVRSLFGKWGGVPRFVLWIPFDLLSSFNVTWSNLNEEEKKSIRDKIINCWQLDGSLNSAIEACNLENILEFDGHLLNEYDRRNHVMHIMVKDDTDYEEYTISFAFEYVARKLVDCVERKDERKINADMMERLINLKK